MAEKHTNLQFRPRALTIEALSNGGYAVRESSMEHRGYPSLASAAFTRLTDAMEWMDEQMRLAEPPASAVTHAINA